MSWPGTTPTNLRAASFRDSEASFKAGDYLKALVGYQKFDATTNKYINYGGYLNVEKIWSSPYSWPQPPYLQQAVQRSQEVISQKLTVQQAEQYIQENTGRRVRRISPKSTCAWASCTSRTATPKTRLTSTNRTRASSQTART